ncbi:hypothetical protein ACMHYJ_14195 [Castellaniella hirudinis]|uniref:hypothetical protein n=1 Tax=Castellaniella hirudinis TaxID=1144617 RepID=UPI0039C36396
MRRTSGGVVDAARFLTERRGRSIHPESLRAKLRAVNGDEISLSMADLLTEWMEEKEGGRAYARDWMLAHAAQNGLAADVVPDDEASPQDLIKDIQAKAMQIGALTGGVLGTTAESLADNIVSPTERDKVVALLRELRTRTHNLERGFLLAADKRACND